MNYWIASDGEQKGPYTRDQLSAMWNSGALTADTQYWIEGAADWKPVTALFAMQTIKEQPAPAQQQQRSRGLWIAISVGIVAAAASAYLVFSRHSSSLGHVAAAQAGEQQSPTAEQRRPTSAPRPPVLNEEAKTRVVTFLDRTGKLRAMTNKGVRLEDFKSQLSEVSGAWDNITTFGFPKQLSSEKNLLETAISAWSLAEEIWSEQMRVGGFPQKSLGNGLDVLCTLDAGSRYGARLEKIGSALRSESVAPPTSPDFADREKFKAKVVIQFLDMTRAVMKQVRQAGGANEIDAYKKSFQESAAAIQNKINTVFGKDAHSFLDEMDFADATAFFGGQPLQASEPVAGAPATIVNPDDAIKWCFAAAATALDAAKNGISARIRQDQEEP